MKGAENTEDFITKLNLKNDLPLMDAYVHAYGDGCAMPMERYLETWYQEKSKFLLPLFNNTLIHEKHIDYIKSNEIIEHDVDEQLFDSSYWSIIGRDLTMMLRFVLFNEKSRWSRFDGVNKDEECFFFDVVNNTLLADTSFYSANALHFYSPAIKVNPSKTNNLLRPLVLQDGQKPFRAIANLVKALEPICREKWPDTFTEKFFTNLHDAVEKSRIIHSRILNDTNIGGTLCLSIHPMDYITMSDNDYNWESCMVWSREDDPGEYRAGTLEMLNSPCVVVAYIKGSKPYFPLGEEEGSTWSNKKWRELFIIDHDFISGIRAYPYQVPSLEDIVLKELAEMAKTSNFSQFADTINETDKSHTILGMAFQTNIMYNDFSCHTCRYITAINPRETDRRGFNYSGPARCLVCGHHLTIDHDSAAEVVCDSCRGIYRCSCCNSAIYEYDDYFTLDNGDILCLDCGVRCDYCGEVKSVEVDPLHYIDINFNRYIYNNTRVDVPCTHMVCTCEDCYEKLKPYTAIKIIANGEWYQRNTDILLPAIPDSVYDQFATWVPDKEDLIDSREPLEA